MKYNFLNELKEYIKNLFFCMCSSARYKTLCSFTPNNGFLDRHRAQLVMFIYIYFFSYPINKYLCIIMFNHKKNACLRLYGSIGSRSKYHKQLNARRLQELCVNNILNIFVLTKKIIFHRLNEFCIATIFALCYRPHLLFVYILYTKCMYSKKKCHNTQHTHTHTFSDTLTNRCLHAPLLSDALR